MIPEPTAPPESVLVNAANPELAPGMTWTYRTLSVDTAFDNKLLEITLIQREATTTTFRLRTDGKDEQVKIEHQGAKYFSPRTAEGGTTRLVAESVLPDSCSKGSSWTVTGKRHAIIENGRIAGWVSDEPNRSALGPILHNIPGGVSPAALVTEGDTQMIISPRLAFAAQVLTAMPEGTRVLFNLTSVRLPDGKEQVVVPPLQSAAWNKLSLWLKDNAVLGIFDRIAVNALVLHVDRQPEMQLVLIGGSKHSKTGKGLCMLWGHKGIITENCDAEALGVVPERFDLFVVP